jgi:peptide/nickel transport system substrate-binding protein
LKVVSVVAPQTLDPAKAAQNDAWFTELAYEPLIVRRSNGRLAPGLARSWAYTGTGNKTFVLSLRPGVKFSDGSALTAQTVVGHLKYVVASGGQMAPMLTGDTFTATGPLTVKITADDPNPNFPEIFTQDFVMGGVISEPGQKSPSKLGTTTSGAGPYMIDSARTVTGNYYTYVPNPHYHDKTAVHWRKVVIRVVTNPQSVLNALRTGQADVSHGDPATLGAARRAGLRVTTSPSLWTGAVLADRGGAQTKPLADVRVRRALNLATDRKSIADALFSGFGAPTNQTTVPGGYGFDPALDKTYPYDVKKARKLLAEAGHPDGFTLRIVTPEYQKLNLVAQALAQQWKKIGVELRITSHANANEYTSDAFGAKFPAFMTAFGHIPTWMAGPSLYLPPAAFNPFHTKDPKLRALFDEEAKSSGPERQSLDRRIQGHLVREAWFVPVVTTGLPYYAGRSVTGTRTSGTSPLMQLYEVRPAK